MKEFWTKSINGMALGLFSSLIIGLILKQLGTLFGIPALIEYGRLAQYCMGPAIGVGVAYALKAPALVLIASLITGAFGAGSIQVVASGYQMRIGEPVGAYIASLAAAFLVSKLAGKTKLDILVLPASTIIVGCLVGHFVAPGIAAALNTLGSLINQATTLHPFWMGICLSVAMGILLTLPISSAAIGISLGLSGLAAGAALVGCCCHMVGFASSSYKENGVSGIIAQGLGTSMLQISNILKNPWIFLPPILASAILGPLSTCVFHMESTAIGSGMGSSGLVGQVATLEVMGQGAIGSIVLLHFLLPAVLTYFFCFILQKKKKIKEGDMLLK